MMIVCIHATHLKSHPIPSHPTPNPKSHSHPNPKSHPKSHPKSQIPSQIPTPIPNPKSHPKSQIPSQIPFKSHLNPVIVEGQKYHHSNRLVETSRMVVFPFFYDHWMPS